MGFVYNPITGNLDLVGTSGGGGGGVATKYSSSFNATTDWGSPSGGYYSITILATTHGLGTTPIIEIFEDIAGVFYDVTPDEVKMNASGDVTFRVPQSPDLRFAGKIVLV